MANKLLIEKMEKLQKKLENQDVQDDVIERNGTAR